MNDDDGNDDGDDGLNGWTTFSLIQRDSSLSYLELPADLCIVYFICGRFASSFRNIQAKS